MYQVAREFPYIAIPTTGISRVKFPAGNNSGNFPREIF